MNITPDQVLNALSHVDDPDLKKDLVTLGMIKDIKISGDTLAFSVVLTTPACPLKEKIRKDCVAAIETYIGQGLKLEINMTSNVTTRTGDKSIKGVKNIVAVISGKGGVGKSTVAANLAVALSHCGAKTALVDCDIYGPSVPILFGLRHDHPVVENRDGKEVMIPIEKFGVKVNSIGFLVPEEQAVVWRGPMASKAMAQLIFDTDWGDTDYLILDMPPGTGDLHLTMVQQLPVTGVVVVTTPQAVALADARKGATMFQQAQINVPLLGIVENMAYFAPPDLPGKKYFIFGEDGGKNLAAELGAVLLGQIPLVQKVRELGDEGVPAAVDFEGEIGKAFIHLAEEVARQVAIRNSNLPPTEKVKIIHS